MAQWRGGWAIGRNDADSERGMLGRVLLEALRPVGVERRRSKFRVRFLTGAVRGRRLEVRSRRGAHSHPQAWTRRRRVSSLLLVEAEVGVSTCTGQKERHVPTRLVARRVLSNVRPLDRRRVAGKILHALRTLACRSNARVA